MYKLALTFLIASAAVACSSGSGVAVASQRQGGTAQGVVVQVNPVFVVDDLANAPAGATAVAGASIRIFDLADMLVAEVASGADGSFSAPGLPAGLLRAEVRLDAASADPDVSVEFTSVPNVVVPLGRTFPVDRAAAAAAALAGVPVSALVVGSLQPFPLGTVVQPAARAESDAITVLAGDAYLFFVDLAPAARFAHPCEFRFVDATSGEVTVVGDLDFYPNVNGAGLWSGSFRYRDPRGDPTSEVVQRIERRASGAGCGARRTRDPRSTRDRAWCRGGDSNPHFK